MENETTTTETKKPRKKRVSKVGPASPDLLTSRLLLRVREFAALTGTPEPTVYHMIATNVLEHVKIGKRSIRIPSSALKKLVA